jgi:hypothetical protein
VDWCNEYGKLLVNMEKLIKCRISRISLPPSYIVSVLMYSLEKPTDAELINVKKQATLLFI